jgi:hypothetical protein
MWIVAVVIVVVIVVILAIVAVMFLFVLATPLTSGPTNSATVEVTINAPLTQSVDYTLTDSGDLVDSDRLSAGSSIMYTIEPSWSGSTCFPHTYVVTTLQGPADVETETVCDGRTYRITLDL